MHRIGWQPAACEFQIEGIGTNSMGIGMKVWVALVAMALGLAGCASKPTMQDVVKEQLAAEEVRAKGERKRAERKQEEMEVYIERMPKWALEPAKPDATGLYALGMSASDSLSVALRKATLDAEFGLAKVYRQEISGAERSVVREKSEKLGSQQFEQVIDKLVARVPVVGYEVVKQEVVLLDGKYNSFVLLKLPYEQFNRVLQEQRAEAPDRVAKEAFDDLERRVRQRQADRLQEERDRQEIRQRELEAKAESLKKLEKPVGNESGEAKKEGS